MTQSYNNGNQNVFQPDSPYTWLSCEIRSYLKVPKVNFKLLNIDDYISSLSRMDEEYIYLEPNNDAQVFIDVIRENGEEFTAKQILVEDLSYLNGTQKFDEYYRIDQPDSQYTWISCEIRSYLKVPKINLKLLEIETYISSYSYMDEKYVYLEEDGDAQKLIDSIEETGQEFIAKRVLVDDLSYLNGTQHYYAAID